VLDGPIKPKDIREHAAYLELDPLEAEALEHVIQSLDAAHLTHNANRAKRAK